MFNTKQWFLITLAGFAVELECSNRSWSIPNGHSVRDWHSFKPKHWLCVMPLLLLWLQPVYPSYTYGTTVHLPNGCQRASLYDGNTGCFNTHAKHKQPIGKVGQKQPTCVQTSHKSQTPGDEQEKEYDFIYFKAIFHQKLAEPEPSPNFISKDLFQRTPTCRIASATGRVSTL